MAQRQGARVVVGRAAVFTQAWMVLVELQQQSRRANGEEVGILKEATDVLHDADRWRRHPTYQGTNVGDETKEVYDFLSRVAGSVKIGESWDAFWGEVRSVACALQSIVDGGALSTTQMETAVRFCFRVSSQQSGPPRPRLV